MSSQFQLLWADLAKTTPMTIAKQTDFEKDRMGIMSQLGMLGPIKKKMGPARPTANKHHGKQARAMANDAHQVALHRESKKDAIKRLEVQTMVHEVEAKNNISKDMAKYVQAQQPIPPRLMKALIGGKMTKPRALPPLVKGKQQGYVPPPTDRVHVARKATVMHTASDNKWPACERDHLIQLYKEIEKPQNAQVELWKIYYTRLADRFRSLYPHRKPLEITNKLQEMIAKRQFHSNAEVKHWQSMKLNKASSTSMQAIEVSDHNSLADTGSLSDSISLSPSRGSRGSPSKGGGSVHSGLGYGSASSSVTGSRAESIQGDGMRTAGSVRSAHTRTPTSAHGKLKEGASAGASATPGSGGNNGNGRRSKNATAPAQAKSRKP